MRTNLKSSFTVALLAFAVSSLAQAPVSFSFQKDDSVLKKVYHDQSLRKKQQLIDGIGKEHASDYKSVYNNYFESVLAFWKSDQTVTDPDANNYLQAVVGRIVKANVELGKLDARIVFSRDAVPNAYSLGDGSIAINAGLFVYLNNESELAFIVCHEIAHYYLDHFGKDLKASIEARNNEDYQAELKRIAKSTYRTNHQVEQLAKSYLFNNRRHKREYEAEADRFAYTLMKKAGYEGQGIRSCLELLDKIDDTLVYSPAAVTKVFDFPNYPFKKKWVQQQSSIFSEMSESSTLKQEERDSLKTHPDCSKRISLLADSISKAGGAAFLVDERKFNQLKNDFFIEMIESLFKQEQLSQHIYYSLMLFEKPGYEPIAIYSLARCFNILYQKQKDHKLGLTVDTEQKGYPKEYNELLRMINRLRLEELAALNYNFCKKYESRMKDYPGFDKELAKATQLFQQQ